MVVLLANAKDYEGLSRSGRTSQEDEDEDGWDKHDTNRLSISSDGVNTIMYKIR